MLLLLVFSFSQAHAIFLAGEGDAGKISILCEGQAAAYVAAPGAQAVMLPLDGAHQAVYVPDAPGPYTVQCGKETKTVVHAVPAANGGGAQAEADGNAAEFAVLAIFFIAAFAAMFFVARRLFFSKAEFRKIVEGDRARLTLCAAKAMDGITISDPVGMDFAGRERKFSIPSLPAGKKWEWEYEVEEPQKALPASLTANYGKQKVSMLSELYIEGRKESGAVGKKGIEDAGNAAAKPLRKLPRAKN